MSNYKGLQMSPFTVDHIIKKFKETGEISLHNGQGRRPLLDVACMFWKAL